MSSTVKACPSLKRRGVRANDPAPARIIRVAIYTRQSVEDRTASGFTSLQAQKESALAYITAMRSEGWEPIDTDYTDSGFSGGNIERPALTRLLTDIQNGLVNAVIVYRLDRLSRSLLDFLSLLKFFEQHQVSFVSVTEQLNTATPAGRLMTSIIGGFAEYERRVISERTSHKMCAARRKGKWCGGPPILGYRVVDKRLVVDKEEAEQVRTIFDLYLQHRGMLPVVAELNRRGWTTKSITYKNGNRKEGVPWNKARLYDILVNVTYIGQVKHQGQIYKGEQGAIVDKRIFAAVQKLLRHNSQNGGADIKNKHGALLRGLLKCGHCGAAMSHTFAKKGNRLYRYYMCNTKMKRGKDACPTPTLPAQEIEDFVVGEIRKLARDPELQRQVFEEAVRQQQKLIPKLEKERKRLQSELQAKREEVRRLATAIGAGKEPATALTGRLGEAEEVAQRLEVRIAELGTELVAHREGQVSIQEICGTLREFDAIWDVLTLPEQAQLVTNSIETLHYDGSGHAAIRFGLARSIERQ